MSVTKLSWYLCILFVAAAALSSAITVAPGGATWLRLQPVFWTVLSLLFAAAAIVFQVTRVPRPKWLLRVFQCVAVVATIAVMLMTIG